MIETLKQTLDPILDTVPGLKPKGTQYEGPCPFCGGTDRFFVTKENPGRFYCRGCEKGGDVIDLHMRIKNCSMVDLMPDKPDKPKKARAIPEHLTDTYQYVDEHGEILSYVGRYEEPDRDKTFRQWIEKDGQKVFKVNGTRKVPYNLPNLVQSDQVFVTEGEKDANRLIELGMAATCFVSAKWNDVYTVYFKDKDVCILQDNDDSGQKFVDTVSAGLCDTAGSVKVLPLPGLRHKGDVSDWLNNGGDKEQLLQLVKETEILSADKIEAVDLFNEMEPKPFPIELMPDVIHEYASDQAELMGVDVGIVALACLAVCSGCTDDRIKIQPKRFDPTWTESPRIWVVIVGPPSVAKSPAIDKATGAVIKVDAALRKESEENLKKWKRECRRLKKSVEKGETDYPDPPILKRITFGDTTVEKLAEQMQQMEPRGALILRDEISGWLYGMDAYNGGSGKDRSDWLEIYNGGYHQVDRISRGSSYIKNWGASVLGGIQPDVIQQYAKVTNYDGMMQRFLIYSASPKKRGVDRLPNKQAKNKYHNLISFLTLINPPKEEQGNVTLSEHAHLVREKLENKIDTATAVLPNRHLQAVLGKWNGLFARLLLTFHAIECAQQYKHPSDIPVTGETAKKVADFLWKTMLPHAVAFYEGMDTGEDNAKLLAALILAKSWDRFTVKRNLNNYMKKFRSMSFYEKKEMLECLEIYGWISPEDKLSHDGIPVAYTVNSEVHARFAAKAEQERDRREKVTKFFQEMNGEM